MTGPAQTGRFWLCPECSRHVPARSNACTCGFDKTTLPVRMRGVDIPGRPSPPTRERSFLRTVLPLAVIAVLVAFIGYDKLGWGTAPSEEASEETPPTATPAPIQAVPMSTVTINDEWASRTAPPSAVQQAPAIYQPPATQDRVIRVEVPEQARPAEQIRPALERAAPIDPMKTEGYWKQRLYQSRERIRSAYEHCRHQAGLGGIGDFGRTSWAQARAVLIAAIESQEQLEEDARRAGALPGWVRFDWRVYPKIGVSEGNEAIFPGDAHPCSVPDIRSFMRDPAR